MDLQSAQLQESSRSASSCRTWQKPWFLCWAHSTEISSVNSEKSSTHPIWDYCIPKWCIEPLRYFPCYLYGNKKTWWLTWASEPMLLRRWSNRLCRASVLWGEKNIGIKCSTENCSLNPVHLTMNNIRMDNPDDWGRLSICTLFD